MSRTSYIIIRVLQSQTFQQTAFGIITALILGIALSLMGERVTWFALPIIAGVVSAMGVGLDLHRTSIGGAVLIAIISSALIVVVAAGTASGLETAQGIRNPKLPFDTALILFIPLFIVVILISRWCARIEAKDKFKRGTALYSSNDVAKRRHLVERFRQRLRGPQE